MSLLLKTLLMTALACMFCARAVAQTSGAREQNARAHYDQGRLHYDLGEYDKAIAEFKEAYAILSMPGLLYDIAQAYRRKGDCRQALVAYANYQRLETSPHDPELLQRQIEEMEQCTRALETQTPVASATAVVDPAAGRGLRWSGIATAALGAAMLAGGAIAGLEARAKADQLEHRCGSLCDFKGHPELKALDSDGHDLAAAATTLFVLGGTGLVTGTALYYFGLRAQTPTSVALAPQPGGAMVS